jgi:hypothetical protein
MEFTLYIVPPQKGSDDIKFSCEINKRDKQALSQHSETRMPQLPKFKWNPIIRQILICKDCKNLYKSTKFPLLLPKNLPIKNLNKSELAKFAYFTNLISKILFSIMHKLVIRVIRF